MKRNIIDFNINNILEQSQYQFKNYKNTPIIKNLENIFKYVQRSN